MNILKLILWAVMPQKLYLGGGGDGGAQAEADRLRAEESKRDYEIAQDKARINALFGVTDYDYATTPDVLVQSGGKLTSAQDAQAGYQSDIERLQGLISAAEADPDYAGSWGVDSSDVGETIGAKPTASWQEQLASAQASLDPITEMLSGYDSDALTEKAAASSTARQGTLDQIYGDILNKYNFEKDKQYGRKSADVKAMLADRGLSRSTVGQSIFDRLNEIRDTTEAKFEEGAGSTVEKIKAADEGTRQNLINMINAGGDYGNARTTALSELDTNLNKYKNEATAADLSNLFKGMDELYGQKQYVDAYNKGQSYGSTNLVTPGGGGSSSGVAVNY